MCGGEMMSRKFIWLLDVGLAEAASGVTRGVAPRPVLCGASITGTGQPIQYQRLSDIPSRIPSKLQLSCLTPNTVINDNSSRISRITQSKKFEKLMKNYRRQTRNTDKIRHFFNFLKVIIQAACVA